jgi:DNA-directed RNA polymerase II subunit RPB2
MTTDIEDVIWKLMDIYFRDNPQCLVKHHIESYDDFLDYDLSQIFKETNPLKLDLEYNEKTNIFESSARIYFGGKNGKQIYFGKPIIYDNNENIHYMFPNEARLRNMTYSIPIYCDLEIDIIRVLTDLDDATNVDKNHIKINIENEVKTVASNELLIKNIRETISDSVQTFKLKTINNIFICNLPIMIQSKYCILRGLPRESRYAFGECKNDFGGYFIIDGKEKTIVSQEKFGDNMLYVRKIDPNNVSENNYLYSAEIRSVSENVAKPIRTFSMKIVAPTSKYTNHNLVVFLPDMKKKAIPLFILFRALGITTDREIISMCLLKDPNDDTVSDTVLNWFLPSIHDAGIIQTQEDALHYLSRLLINEKTIHHVLYVLADYLLPHIGEMNFKEKAYFLGYMVYQLWATSNQLEPPTDRDNYKYKRIELVGSLLRDLFREYFIQYQNKIRVKFETKYEFNKEIYKDISYLIEHTYTEVLEENIVQEGIQKAFKGNWGASTYSKRIGVVQDLNRLSNNGMISHLRKTNLPLDPSVKLVGPRVLHSSQWGIIDPIDTPDGGNIGIHKYLAMLTYITRKHSREPLIKWMMKHTNIILLENTYPIALGKMTKVFINGYWFGSLNDPDVTVIKMKECRRHGLIPISTSISFDITRNIIYIYTDGGRMCRPIFYKDETTHKFPFQDQTIWESFLKKLFNKESTITWTDIISGFHSKLDPNFDPTKGIIYEWNKLYDDSIDKIKEQKAILDYIDSNESESALIALNHLEISPHSTHHEIHESTLYGVMCNQINYIEHNPATRNSFSCGQSKQACSLYHTNYTFRMDKTAVVLNYGQIPLIKSRYMKYINNEENPYGENAIVAVMCFTGYNVEDAILINEGALKRGLFRTTYYTTYETHEEKETKGDNNYLKIFHNIENLIRENNIVGTKPGYDYSKLNEFGIIQENIEIDEKTVLIGSVSSSNFGNKKDESKVPKKGQIGFVDKSFMTESEEGQRIAKVRIREQRIPAIGDKMASRAGQKGTIGMVIPETDMPFTRSGIRPDLIINPHALPSRMTIGQIVECISGKACAHYGTFGDCTPFVNLRQNMVGFFGELLTKLGFHSSGNEIMYDGMTGTQIESEIFMGPTYYMRLKHMVKDKINYRARGPLTNLTRQPVSGRANDGGLRIGEMERDGVISHGAAYFLKESMMERADAYQIAVCNKTGMLAIYNPYKNLLFSPMADGPVKYAGSITDGLSEGQLHPISKFGREFSIVAVPYSFKLFMQELLAMNIRMSLITEDNISQIENMSFSISIDPKTIIDETRNRVSSNTKYSPHSPEIPPPSTPKYSPLEPEPEPEPEPKLDLELPKSTEVPNSPIPLQQPPQPQVPNSIPLQPQTQIPNSPIEEEIKVGGKVHYRGDVKPSRYWNIDQIGAKYCTISTDDDYQLDTENTIKVVRPDEIYLPNDDFIYSIPMDIPLENIQNQNPIQTQQPQQIDTPSINFAPVIKIINDGNDMSTTATDTLPIPPPMTLPLMAMPSPPPPPPSGLEPLQTNEIDFSIPIIKK